MLYRITYLTRRKIFKYQENKLKSQTFVVMIDFYQTQNSCGLMVQLFFSMSCVTELLTDSSYSFMILLNNGKSYTFILILILSLRKPNLIYFHCDIK
jgi:hypothetical protein